jgi:CheY-like chemotaxis protein
MRTSTILLCEDDPVQARLVTLQLEKLGYRIIGPHGTPQQAENAARKERVDAALLDVSLEGGSSREAAARLEERGVPFAFVTAYGPETTATVRAYPQHLVTPKPVSPELLSEILAALLPSDAIAAAN